MHMRMVPGFGRRRFLCGCCAGAASAWMPAPVRSAAQEAVPAHLEPHHHVRFENEYVRVLEVTLEPGEATLFHEHSFDLAVVFIRGGWIRNEPLGAAQAAEGHPPDGAVFFNGYRGRRFVHRVTNLDAARMVQLDFEVLVPEPGRFAVASRDAAYAPVLDNDRLRAWRVALQPGQAAPPIAQAGPGVRVVLGGDQLTEEPEGAPERRIRLRPGSFEWQPPGRVRRIRNTGALPAELVEFEIR